MAASSQQHFVGSVADDERDRLVSGVVHADRSGLRSWCWSCKTLFEQDKSLGPDNSHCDAERLHLFIDSHSMLVHPPTLANGVPGLSYAEWLGVIRAAERFAKQQPSSARHDEASQLRYEAKLAIRCAFPCGDVIVEPVNQGNCLGKLLGQRIIVRPGTSGSHESHTLHFAKLSPDMQMGVQLSGKKYSAREAPKGLLWLPSCAPSVGLAPTIVSPGALLEGAGVNIGDELLWVDDEEAKSPAIAAALLADAEQGDVRVIVRRKRKQPLEDWWSVYEANRAPAMVRVS